MSLARTSKLYDRTSLGSNQQAVISMMRPGTRVLEIGCATGFMTRYMTENMNCRVVGVEIDPVQAELSRPYAEKVVEGDVGSPEVWEELAGTDSPYDYIVMCEVLEHLRDPWQVLRMCHSILKNDGAILASIPNIAYYKIRLKLLMGSFEYTPFGILDDTHLRFFTAGSALRLFTSTGYSVNNFIRMYRKGKRVLGTLLPNAFTYQFVIKASRIE